MKRLLQWFFVLCWFFHWLVVEIMIKVQIRMMRTTKKVIRLATRLDIMMGSSKWPKTKSTLHSFRDLLQLPLNNSCRITLRFREKRLP